MIDIQLYDIFNKYISLQIFFFPFPAISHSTIWLYIAYILLFYRFIE